MQDINWGNFKTKFDGKEQKTFELLSYLLFCDEFGQRNGIFRYKNQVGIETEPIVVNGEMVGLQAKFYETKISDNVEDIIDSIQKAKGKNQNLQRLLFYTNKEFSESRKKGQKEPQYKIDIEGAARRQGIRIEWKVPSNFEAQLALPHNQSKAEYFFSLDKGVIDCIEELIEHTHSILDPISSNIQFRETEIKIDRSETLRNLTSALDASSVVIVSGEGGVGKTALIKDWYSQLSESIPFFIFKGTEFNISHINELFHRYGSLTLQGFIDEFTDFTEKYIVIDSAEKLSDAEDQGAFQEFLYVLLKNKWKIIFTTRYSYLEDLKFQLVDTYRLTFLPVNIEKLSLKELVTYSESHTFRLPNNDRLLDILRNPFYLKEYLQNYESIKITVTPSDFKSIIWRRVIQASSTRNNLHVRREECFLQIAQKRAEQGLFFVTTDGCDGETLRNLEIDEIIKRDPTTGGYFITHDIYEEWALDKLIERSFLKAEDYQSFFRSLSSSLPIRRAFRAWLSEKLLQNPNQVKLLVETTINDDNVEPFWRDEILIAVLLSEHAETLFQLYEQTLLEDGQRLLVRIIFLLRIACKEIDDRLLQSLGLQKTDALSLQTFFTKPKGSGWNATINFIHAHLGTLGLEHMRIILPLLDDWINQHKEGETTKQAGQIGLFYYAELSGDGDYRSGPHDKNRDQLFHVILQSASEIKDELNTIFEEVIRERQTSNEGKHYALVHTVLTSLIDCIEVVKALPEQVLRLADLFWFQTRSRRFGHPANRVEDSFGVPPNHFEYYPASAFQTPIFQLLRSFPEGTLDFILAFTNKVVECYATSDLDGPIGEVTVVISETETIKQYISPRLWCMYRGTQVAPALLESIHMALERWLLDYAKSAPQEYLEMVCKYLIRNSRSASITAVVVSVVLAYPQKLFSIAAIVFQTKDFFLHDSRRILLDQTAKSLYAIGYGPGDKKLYFDERIKTCDDPHRKLALENMALTYQLFKSEEESVEEAERRQQVLWAIFDHYYRELPDKEKETASDKTWQMYLARMDRRKMRPALEEKDGQLLITLNPELDPDLRKYSEESVKQGSAAMQYLPLQLWANYRFQREEDKYKQYQQYETDPLLALSQTKEIVEKLKSASDADFSLFNHATPAYSCSVLLRDFIERLSLEDKAFCKDNILEFATRPLRIEQYHYQASDGVEPSIITLPELLQYFPDEKEDLLLLLFFLLLNSWQEIATFAIRGILQRLWEISFRDAHSLFLGYLLLKERYDSLREEIIQENYQKNVSISSEKQVLERFEQQYEKELDDIVANTITFEAIQHPEALDLEILKIAFELLPLRTTNNDHKRFLHLIFPVFAKRLFRYDERIEYSLRQRFLGKLAYFILTSPKSEIKGYLQPFVIHFTNAREMAEFFEAFISAEDALHQYEEFWMVWNAFYNKIVEVSQQPGKYSYSKEIIRTYLLAWSYWRENITEWHSLKEREKVFFRKVAVEMGHCPAVLYSLAKILTTIASNYLEEGISWLSTIIQRNKELATEELETNTIYYVENVVRRYILRNRQKTKTTIQIRNQVITILNFLVERGSSAGYLLRESIL
jgi:hypothetical protein